MLRGNDLSLIARKTYLFGMIIATGWLPTWTCDMQVGAGTETRAVSPVKTGAGAEVEHALAPP